MPWKGVSPKISDDAFIAPNATIIGDVEVGPKASIWFNCVLRGDVNKIRIGARTNIQDGTIVHVDREADAKDDGYPTLIGDDVLVGHNAMIHGTTIENGGFVGMCATLLDGAYVEGEAMVAAGALVGPGKRILRHQLWGGVPARYLRDMKPGEISYAPDGVAHYVKLAEGYRAHFSKNPA
jgi:carbonic anhydrase/acetyltransferase-like protein (isoleucine patch superfamily)